MIRTVTTLALSFFCGAFAIQAMAEPGLYTLGHGDIGPSYENGQFKLQLHLDASGIVDGQRVDPAGVSFAPGDLIVTLPDVPVQSPDSRFDFTGVSTGENFWLIAQSNAQAYSLSVPWLGWSTEELISGDWVGNRIDFRLIGKTGPGHVSMFNSPNGPGSPPAVHFATFDGIDGNDVAGLADDLPGLLVGQHMHANWAFTQPGLYELTFKASGTHAIDGYKEAVGTFRFAIAVPEPGSAALLALAAPAALAFRRCRKHR